MPLLLDKSVTDSHWVFKIITNLMVRLINLSWLLRNFSIIWYGLGGDFCPCYKDDNQLFELLLQLFMFIKDYILV